MKKYKFLLGLMIIILSGSINSYAAQKSISTPYELDEKYDDEINKTDGVTDSMIDVTDKYAALWEKEMNQYYDLLNETMDENGQSVLFNAQKAWESYIDQNNQVTLLCNSYEGGGTSLKLIESSLQYNKFRDRAIFIMSLYNGKSDLKTSIESTYKTDTEDLDKKFKEDIEKANGTAEKTDTLHKYSAFWKSRMDQNYSLMLKEMARDDQTKLANCQSAWETYSSQNNQLILYCSSLFHYGGDSEQEAAELEYSKYRERSKELRDLSGLFKNQDGQGPETEDREALSPSEIAGDSTYNSPDLCRQGENAVLSFQLVDSDDTVSVCVGGTEKGYIVLRISLDGTIQEYPDDRDNSWDYFKYDYYLRGGGIDNEGLDLNNLTYEDEDVVIRISEDYSANSGKTSLILTTTNKKTGEETERDGKEEGRKGSLISLRDNENIKAVL